MKSIFLLSILFCCSLLASGQVPAGFNYQGIARNQQGQPYANTTIALRLKILNGAVNGPELYSETRTVTTNAQGLFNVVIGSAGAISKTGDFATVDWISGARFLATEIDPAGGSNFTSIGTTQLQSVPFAMMSNKLQIPFFSTITSSGYMFMLTNNGTGSALRSETKSGTALLAITESGTAITASNTKPEGTAVLANASQGGYALITNGKIKFSGVGMQTEAGYVLTSNENGDATWQKPYFAAFRANGLKDYAEQPINYNTWKKVFFQVNPSYNIGSLYDGANALLFIQENGIYHLNGQVSWEHYTTDTRIRLMLLRKGVISELAYDHEGDYNATSAFRTNQFSTDISLQNNDALWVEVWQLNTGNNSRSLSPGGQHSWFSGHLVHKL